ncbi:MAG TPA: type II secretion system F family protein [Planctomycetota bacterium]|nr:type II secretion system F family protein [Planctomycetota bacterium]
MARFSYRAAGGRGAEEQGEIEAPSLEEATLALRGRGLVVFVLERRGSQEERRTVPDLDAFAFFNRSLGDMARLGLPLPESVRAIGRGLGRGKFRASLERMEAALREGKGLAAAAEEISSELPSSYGAMIRAGGASRDLPGVLSAIAGNAASVRRARRALAEALAYPVLILGLGGLLVAALLAFFGPVYRDFSRRYAKAPSPFVRVVMAAEGSRPVQAGLALAAVLGLVGFRWAGERLPVVGRIRRRLELSRMLGTLGALLRARVPLPAALPLALDASGSRALAAEAPGLVGRAREGASLGDVLGASSEIPPSLRAALGFAERTGTAAAAAEETATHLSDLAAADSEGLRRILSPVALFAAGGVLGAIVTGLMLPYVRFLEGLSR